mgnify:FL=1
MWLAAAITALCWLFIVWASPRGFDFTDDAAALADIAYAGSFRALLSSYGRLWYPFYVLVSGDITLLRLTDVVVLGICGSVFAWALVQFAFPDGCSRLMKAAIFATLLSGVLWRYYKWLPTPNYNSLMLSGLMLLMAALLLRPAPDESPSVALRHGIGAALVAGVSLAILGLTKASSAVVMVVLALAWLWLTRPRNGMISLTVAAISCLSVLAIAAILMDGSIPIFIQSLKDAYHVQTLRETGSGDFHGIGNSIVQPFLARYILKSLAVGAAALLLTGMAYVTLVLADREGSHLVGRRCLAVVVALGLVCLIAWWRIQNIHDPKVNLVAYAWYFAVPAVLGAVVLWTLPAWRTSSAHRGGIFSGAIIAGLVPFAFAFGTDVPIYLAAAQSSVFWMASAILLCALLPGIARERAIVAVALLSTTVTAGMLAGVAAAPGRIGEPLWEQSEEVVIGPAQAHLLVSATTADFLEQAQQLTASHGLKPRTTIINATETGPGLPFALGGISPGLAWLRWEGKKPTAYSREAIRVNRDSLAHAWIITGEGGDAITPSTLRGGGIAVSGDYRAVGHIHHRAFGWDLVFWCPVLDCRD